MVNDGKLYGAHDDMTMVLLLWTGSLGGSSRLIMMMTMVLMIMIMNDYDNDYDDGKGALILDTGSLGVSI